MIKSVSIEDNVSLGEKAYVELERRIVTAELEPGTWITEASIGEQLGISRTPIREAVRRLARAKLVEIEPRRGLKITPINVFDQLSLLRFRRPVENFMTREAARNADDEERAYFSELAVAMEQSASGMNLEHHYEIDQDYKRQLVKCAKNEYATSALEPLWAASRRFAWVTRRTRDIPAVAHVTAATMQAIASGDLVKTASATTAFINYLEAQARRSLKEDWR
ncbi:GntR family transcriptional regulator [Mesorhizobium sp. A623]